MKKILFIALLSLNSVAIAQDIPKAFQGKWVGTWQSKIKPNQIKAYCQANDFDNALTLVINKKTMQFDYWEASETANNFTFSKYKPNYLLGLANFNQSGFTEDEAGDLSDKNITINRKIEFILKDGDLIELYRDDHNQTGKPIWQKRYWKKCP